MTPDMFTLDPGRLTPRGWEILTAVLLYRAAAARSRGGQPHPSEPARLAARDTISRLAGRVSDGLVEALRAEHFDRGRRAQDLYRPLVRLELAVVLSRHVAPCCASHDSDRCLGEFCCEGCPER